MTCFAGGSSPAGHAGLIAVAVAFVVAENVVARPAEFGARSVIVVGLALDPYTIGQYQITIPGSFVS